jgi:hypothetical protein
MIYDIDKYRHIVAPQVKSRREYLPNESLRDAITAITHGTTCPILIVAHLIGEHEGYTPSLLKYIDGLMKFYNPDKVLGVVPEYYEDPKE